MQTGMHARMHARAHARTHIRPHMHARTHARTRTRARKCTCAHTRTRAHARAHTRTRTRVRTHTCTRTRARAHTYTHTHTNAHACLGSVHKHAHKCMRTGTACFVRTYVQADSCGSHISPITTHRHNSRTHAQMVQLSEHKRATQSAGRLQQLNVVRRFERARKALSMHKKF